MIVTDADLAAAISNISASQAVNGKAIFTIDRVVVVNLTLTPIKNSKGAMVMNALFVIIFHVRGRGTDVLVHQAKEKEKVPQIWTMKYISRIEHKV